MPPSFLAVKKLYQPLGVLRIEHGRYAHACFFFYYAAPDCEVTPTRSQHKHGTRFNRLNEGLFVRCFCPPCSCIPAFVEFCRRNRHVTKERHCGCFPIMLSVTLSQISGFVVPLLWWWWCSNCRAAHVPLTEHASRLRFSLRIVYMNYIQ